MDRKEFIKSTCGICVAMSTGFLWSLIEACKTPLSVYKTTAASNIVRVPLTEFKESNYKVIRISDYDYDLAVQKNVDDSFSVMVLMCTHAGHPLTKTGQNYYCTLHGSQFDHEGHVTKGPASRDLKHLQAKTDNDFLLIQLS